MANERYDTRYFVKLFVFLCIADIILLWPRCLLVKHHSIKLLSRKTLICF